MKYIFILSFSLQRYFEVYHLLPNTTYEFRLWANNYLGAGDIEYTFATTLSQLTDRGKHFLNVFLQLKKKLNFGKKISCIRYHGNRSQRH